MSDKTILFKYEKLMNSLSNIYRTNIPKEVVLCLVKEQIKDMSKWTISRNTVSGRDVSIKTYSAPKSKRYVMAPYEKYITNAQNLIMEALEEKLMALSLIHMTVAKKVNEVLKIENEKQFLFGSIAPDIAKMVGSTRKKSHFIL